MLLHFQSFLELFYICTQVYHFYANFISTTSIIYYYFLASPYGKTKRVRWSQKEQETALKGFAKYMENLKLPSLKEIQEVKKKYTCLAQRTSPQIKTWLHNKQKALRLCKYLLFF